MNKEESKSSVSRQKKMTDKRIRLGLCPKCGEKQDRDGWYCSKCLKKRNSYLKESREFYSKIGICPICCPFYRPLFILFWISFEKAGN